MMTQNNNDDETDIHNDDTKNPQLATQNIHI